MYLSQFIYLTLFFGALYNFHVLTRSLPSEIQSTEMRQLRRILGITKKDRIKNNLIRHGFQVKPVCKHIEGMPAHMVWAPEANGWREASLKDLGGKGIGKNRERPKIT